MPEPIHDLSPLDTAPDGWLVETIDWRTKCSYEDLDKEITRKLALRVMYGPGFETGRFKPTCKNVWKGSEFSRGHHSPAGKGKKYSNFTDGNPPELGFCIELLEDGIRVCGCEFTVLSDGCAVHSRVFGWTRNEVFVKMRRNSPITWRDVLHPRIVEDIEKAHYKSLESTVDNKAMETQRLKDKAITEGRAEYEVFEEDKRRRREELEQERSNTVSAPPTAPAPPTPAELRRLALEAKFNAKPQFGKQPKGGKKKKN